MYVAAFLITWTFVFVECLREINVIEPGDAGVAVLAALRMFFQPLQGFFNLTIFVYHKVYMVLRSDEDLTIAEALEIVFLHPGEMKDSVKICNLDLFLDNSAHLPQSDVEEVSSRSSHDPSIVLSTSAGSTELPADREPAGNSYYAGRVHIPKSNLPPNWPAVTQNKRGCTSNGSYQGSYLPDFGLDTIEEIIERQ